MRLRSRALVSFLPALAMTTAACATPRAPATRRDDVVDMMHGVRVADPYRWLEDAARPDVQAWMSAQDAAARSYLAGLRGRDALARRFRQLYYVESIAAPYRRGGRFFYTRTHPNTEKAILYWREGESGPEHVLLDPNGWSRDGTTSLGTWMPSWDGRRVVYGRRENGEDEATLHVIDVNSGSVSDVDVIPGGKYAQPSWTPDSAGFFYEWLPTDPSIPVSDRPGYTEIRFHLLGSDPARDPIIRPRTGDPRTFLSQALSRSGRWLFVYVQRGWNEDDIWIRDLQDGGPFKEVIRGKDANYLAAEWDGNIYILTDEGAPRRRVFKTSAAAPERSNWREIVPEESSATLDDLNVAGGRLVLSYLRDASSELRTAALDGTGMTRVALPGIGSVSMVVGNPQDDDAYLGFSSFTTPSEVWRLSVATNATSLWARAQVPIDPSRFETEQVFFQSRDGTRVPMFLVHRKGMLRDGRNPTVLYGYGGFNVSLTPNYRGSIYPWLEAGGLYAVANLRGGGEQGKAWHDAGRGAHKQNVFDDFAAAAEYLEREGWTRPSRLGINGGSNGGLLMGAAMTQHPELYGAVVCQVPLLDMLRYHRFGSGETWVPEYGRADDPEQFRTLFAYSPYHHVKDGTRYPPLLMMSADHDDRVDPMHARKFVAAVQVAEAGLPDPPPAFIRIERNAGHHGSDQVRRDVEVSADMYAFLFHALGVSPDGQH